MSLVLYNSLSRSKELFSPLNDPVQLYTCGPTVYDFAHIGNFRTYTFEDLLRRTLQFLGYKVHQVQNLTDVDDKTIRGALGQGLALHEYTDKYIQAFFQDLDALGIERAEHYPRATDYIPQMIEMIQALIDKGVAYRSSDGSIYFSIARFPTYGALAHLSVENLSAGASGRVVTEEYEKDQVADFVLWKAYDPERDGTIYWDSPFGKGRPGWHIECSAMAMTLLGPSIDIHCGGVDNLFPHHENEIAQSEAASGKPFVRYWLHSEHLVVEGRKMSKSLGNFFTLRDLLAKGYSGVDVRWLLLQGHYRMPLNFTWASLEASKTSLQRIRDFAARLETQQPNPSAPAIADRLTVARADFAKALADDLNSSAATAVLFDLIREVNSLCDSNRLDQPSQVLDLLRQMDGVFNVLFTAEAPPPAEALALLDQRNAARKERNWALADNLRDQLLSQGYLIEDAASGSRLKKK